MPSGLGYIVIDRSIEGWKYWGNAAIRGFWLYLIEKANWRDGWFGKGISVPRGSFITSIDRLAVENEISKNTVRKYLDFLKEEGQITVETSNKYTKITVLKYDEYQRIDDSWCSKYDHQNEHQTEHQSEHQTEHQREHNRRKKERKKLTKEEYAREASPSPARSSSESQEDEALRAELLAKLKGEL